MNTTLTRAIARILAYWTLGAILAAGPWLLTLLVWPHSVLAACSGILWATLAALLLERVGRRRGL